MVLGALISLPSLVFVCPTVLPLLPPVLFESLFFVFVGYYCFGGLLSQDCILRDLVGHAF